MQPLFIFSYLMKIKSSWVLTFIKYYFLPLLDVHLTAKKKGERLGLKENKRIFQGPIIKVLDSIKFTKEREP